MNTNRAMTLIELLVVVAIIAMLVGIVAPGLSAARRSAQRVTCQTQLHQIGTAVWEYSVANEDRVPYVFSPMTNGGAVAGFGNPAYSNAEVDPYDRALWPDSLQNVLMPLYLGDDRRIFTCPAANIGWPRDAGSFQMTYRDAGANQPNGVIAPLGSYLRESFGFLDGRPMVELRIRLTGNPIVDAQLLGRLRGTYARDMVLRETDRVVGPHDGGINVLNREFGVEYRNRETTQADLAPFGAGVQF